MGKVSLNINGRKYGMGCEDGEEERLLRLGQRLDDRVAAMANQFGQIGDIRLMVMAGITLLDELEDSKKNIEDQLDRRMGDMKTENTRLSGALSRMETKTTDSLLDAAARIEVLAEKLTPQA